ncbi:hypothetical protein BC831DRAFT_514769 [Entophlyctis helioformis]|nr:hypothetical protein BC831DRAFT_514769 [Entophlyctis helioformis]
MDSLFAILGVRCGTVPLAHGIAARRRLRRSSVAPLLIETSVFSVDARAVDARLRLSRKARSLRTPLALLSQHHNTEFTARRHYWTRVSRLLFNRLNLSAFAPPVARNDPLPSFSILDRTNLRIARTSLLSPKSDLATAFFARQLTDISFANSPCFGYDLADGVRTLLLARIDGLWTLKFALRLNLLAANHPFTDGYCILCNQSLNGTHEWAHFVVSCTGLAIQRDDANLAPFIAQISEAIEHKLPESNDPAALAALGYDDDLLATFRTIRSLGSVVTGNKSMHLETSSVAPLLIETSVFSVDARAVDARLRLSRKARSLRTPLALLSQHHNTEFTARRHYWTRVSRLLFNRLNLSAFAPPVARNDPLPSFSILDRTNLRIARTSLLSPKSDLATAFFARQLTDISFANSPCFGYDLADGVRTLLLARIDGLWTLKFALRLNLLAANHPFTDGYCILCNQSLNGTHEWAHFVVSCTGLAIQRDDANLAPFIAQISEAIEHKLPESNDPAALAALGYDDDLLATFRTIRSLGSVVTGNKSMHLETCVHSPRECAHFFRRPMVCSSVLYGYITVDVSDQGDDITEGSTHGLKLERQVFALIRGLMFVDNVVVILAESHVACGHK